MQKSEIRNQTQQFAFQDSIFGNKKITSDKLSEDIENAKLHFLRNFPKMTIFKQYFYAALKSFPYKTWKEKHLTHKVETHYPKRQNALASDDSARSLLSCSLPT